MSKTEKRNVAKGDWKEKHAVDTRIVYILICNHCSSRPRANRRRRLWFRPILAGNSSRSLVYLNNFVATPRYLYQSQHLRPALHAFNVTFESDNGPAGN